MYLDCSFLWILGYLDCWFIWICEYLDCCFSGFLCIWIVVSLDSCVFGLLVSLDSYVSGLFISLDSWVFGLLVYLDSCLFFNSLARGGGTHPEESDSSICIDHTDIKNGKIKNLFVTCLMRNLKAIVEIENNF